MQEIGWWREMASSGSEQGQAAINCKNSDELGFWKIPVFCF